MIINDKLRILEDFRRVSCYIQQDDRIQPLLTVQENMSLAADLKLGPRVSRKDKNILVSKHKQDDETKVHKFFFQGLWLYEMRKIENVVHLKMKNNYELS